jgi:ABC-type uncharacterized transport system substrate-binding protein
VRRRDFIKVIAGSATAWPLAILAQVSTRKPLIAILSAVTRAHNIPLDALVQGLQELGYVEGRSADFAFRFAEGKLDRLPALVQELVQLAPDVIVVGVTPAAVAARALTRTIPIVCPLLANPIGFGLIASESRPGGNVTGVLFRTEGLACKQVELALQLIPSLSKVGLLVNVASGVIIDRQDAESASKAAAIKLIAAEVRMADELQGAFEAFANEHV